MTINQPRLHIDCGEAHAVIELQDVGLVGRADQCTVRIDDGRVSRNHASVTLTPEGWLLQDLDSAGGTWMAFDRVEHLLITDFVEVQLGDPVSGPLLRLVPEDVLEATDRALGRSSRPNSMPARPPSGVFTAAHAPRGRTRIGRAPDNEVVVDDLLVSRYHAELYSTDAGF